MKGRVSDLRAIFFAVFGFTCWVLGDSCIQPIGRYVDAGGEIDGTDAFLTRCGGQ